MMRNSARWPSSGSTSEAVTVRPQIPWGSVLSFGFLLGLGMIGVGVALSAFRPADRYAFIACVATLDAWLLVAGFRLLLMSRLASLRIDGETFTFVSLLGRQRAVPRRSVEKIVQATLDVNLVRSSFTLSYYLFLDRTGRTILKLPRKWWPEAAVGTIGRTLGVTVTGDFLELIEGPAFRDQFPGAISWPAAHPRVCLLLGFVLGLPSIVVLATFLTSR